jgi:protocatechuate 3,4-dioxygenase beta subunit
MRRTLLLFLVVTAVLIPARSAAQTPASPDLTSMSGGLVSLYRSIRLNLIEAKAQSPHIAPANAPSTGRMTPAGEPGPALNVSGVVVDAAGKPVAGASLYAYQTDAEGYYGVKPVSDNRNPRLKIFLRTDAQGRWAFDTIRPGSYPATSVPAHIHFEVSAQEFANRNFEIVFTGDRFITAGMRTNPAFSVRPVENGRVTERIVLNRQ